MATTRRLLRPALLTASLLVMFISAAGCLYPYSSLLWPFAPSGPEDVRFAALISDGAVTFCYTSKPDFLTATRGGVVVAKSKDAPLDRISVSFLGFAYRNYGFISTGEATIRRLSLPFWVSLVGSMGYPLWWLFSEWRRTQKPRRRRHSWEHS